MPTPSEYRTLPLTQNQVALVDDADYTRLAQFKWSAQWDIHKQSFYAVRTVTTANGRKRIRMHREILNLSASDKRQGDHRNGDTLDNRRENLRISTHAQNQQNKATQGNNQSGFKGVTWDKQRKKWHAYIKANGRQTHLGYFFSPEDAHTAYCEAATRLHGEFARFG